MNLKIILYIIFTAIIASYCSHAQELTSVQPTPLKKIEISEKIIEKELPFYRYSIKELIEEVEKNIKKAEKGIVDEKLREKNLDRELAIRKHYIEGMYLYKHGKLEESRKEFLKALEISQDPEMEGYIKKSAKWPK